MRTTTGCAILISTRRETFSRGIAVKLGRDEVLLDGHTPVRILLADDDARIRTAMQILLRQEGESLLVRESTDLGSLATQVRQFQPHLVLLDWELPGRPAAAILFGFQGLGFRPRVIVLSARPEAEGDVLAAGADAFVSKGDAPEHFLYTFRRLVNELREGALH